MRLPTAIVILSGGLDSATALYLSHSSFRIVKTLTFDYGQRAVAREINAAREISSILSIPHTVFTLPWVSEITRTALVNRQNCLPHPSESDLNRQDVGMENAKSVWVPNRNGLFLNIGATIAEAEGIDSLITGFNAEEAATFPDNSEAFLKAANEFFAYATLKKIKVESPTLTLTKAEIAFRARELGIPFSKLWFCYEGEAIPCRRCESCRRNFRAFRQVGIADPFESS